MSKTESISQNNTRFIERFTIPFEIILIYICTGLIILTFFDNIRDFFYATLAYIAFFMFLSIFITMLAYTIFNFYYFVKVYISR